MKVILTGGGTAGSVMPLLALQQKLRHQNPDTEFLFIGTRQGNPERELAEDSGIAYHAIYAGKLRRYFDLRNISDIFTTVVGFFQALVVVAKFRPDIIVGAGGFVSVPVIWAGWVHRKKILIHQQDIQPSLSNILTMNFAHKITVSFEGSLRHFPTSKTVWTGNPVRPDIDTGSRDNALRQFNLQADLPVVLITGGGTGSQQLNTIVQQALPKLVPYCQIIHITGKGKSVVGIDDPHYHQYEFIAAGMVDVLSVADIIISRAGLSSLTEYAALGKTVLLVPLPRSHQEINASYVEEKQAAIVIQEKDISPGRLADRVRTLLDDEGTRRQLQLHMARLMKKNAADTITAYINELVTT